MLSTGHESQTQFCIAGVVGLAIARALALSGREVVVLESESAIGTSTSARNSEVVHSGEASRATRCLSGMLWRTLIRSAQAA